MALLVAIALLLASVPRGAVVAAAVVELVLMVEGAVLTSVQMKRPSDPPEETTEKPIGMSASSTLIGAALSL